MCLSLGVDTDQTMVNQTELQLVLIKTLGYIRNWHEGMIAFSQRS